MNFSLLKKGFASLLIAVLSLSVLAGCQELQQQTGTAEQVKKNNQYMADVNRKMDDLQQGLNSFKEAVSRGDIVSMRTQADAAYKAIDELKALEAPENLKGIQDKYVEGCEKLKTALNDYIQLYTDIDSATDANPFDWSTYNERLDQVKSQYDEGIKKLEEADKEAVDQPND